MPVFISYRHSDRLDAFTINERLKLEGIATQLDLFDNDDQQTTDAICGLITRHVNSCSHLIVVLSQDTPHAWWLPFQLGAGTLTNRRMSLYQYAGSAPSGYLEKWPIMTTREHIDLFVHAYHDERTFKRSITREDPDAQATNRANADFFHADLKAKIRRGF
ncbi:hypothetical protein D3C77_284650 [compost metagenome]|uniref:toll/interleukin-1 receptor domain-containing protein n=1 Tax=Pseudomonas vranovensis TaxID=321661 RepID=UPI00041F4469|nr:toll/interleukin-1 receptor domain-containing protein [Pseudomonas vranovensis]